MIPKTIHYIWFGGKELPKSAQVYIETWKKFCPDYTIMRWDETNFDVTVNDYVREAFESKKWAFVSDYVRLWVLVNHGGIYMDTDVELTAPLDEFLTHRAFSGFESNTSIPTGLMACEKGFPLFCELLHDYDGRKFIKPDGSFDVTTNVVAITNTCLKHGLVLNNKFQEPCGFALYPNDWFCPKSHDTGEIHLTKNTHAIHHFNGSWLDSTEHELIERRQSFLLRHPGCPPRLAGAWIRLVHGCKTGDFAPFIRMLKMSIGQ
ncbi:glycosyltransferase family 32 protein [Enorma massiliensis]|uniref:glycosyltransferase family 32 protein n=1 Tax=Enorma massiliensis TaxID=1472761 RepID=UPI002E779140|nr:glycosyltransferase [Enorma massiliensis]